MLNRISKFLAKDWVIDILLDQAFSTPYFHLPSYMERYWLVPYADPAAGHGCGPVNGFKRPLAWLIQKAGYAIRIHHILRADNAPDMHDHPWGARTFILRGWYAEQRIDGVYYRFAGDTATLKCGEFHHIERVSKGGVITLFITGPKRGSWGFLVDGKKIPWQEYTGRD